MRLIKKIFLMPIIMILWLLYIVGDCLLRAMCNVVGIVMPVWLICMIYLIVKQLWISVMILGGVMVVGFIVLLLSSRLVVAIDDLRDMI